MSIDTANILAAALTLPESERADLAFQLLGTLRPPAATNEDEPGFAEELERRSNKFASGGEIAATIDEVTERIRGALRNRKPS